MSARRLMVTTLLMALGAVVVAHLGPDGAALRDALVHPQHVADTAGPDAVVLAWAAALAWVVWAWGAVGLSLTAATAVPGLLGHVAGALLRGVLPAGARRAAAVALGIGLGVGLTTPAVATTADPVVAAAPDWPATPGAPDWPDAVADRPTPDRPAPGDGEEDHVVVRGDCLWDIAAANGRAAGPRPTDAEIDRAVTAWWTTNRSVIGPDPDLLLPGQVLHPPGHD